MPTVDLKTLHETDARALQFEWRTMQNAAIGLGLLPAWASGSNTATLLDAAAADQLLEHLVATYVDTPPPIEGLISLPALARHLALDAGTLANQARALGVELHDGHKDGGPFIARASLADALRGDGPRAAAALARLDAEATR